MVKRYQRSKKRFKTARSAWMDIADKTGIRPNEVKNRHTSTKWVWILKK